MRWLIKCSIGKTITIEWLQNHVAKERMKLVSMEPPAPELNKAYQKFAYVLHYICGGEGHNDINSMVINSIVESYIIGGDKTVRGVKIRASQIVRGGIEVKINTSEILENQHIACMPDGSSLSAIIDSLEMECFKYIDGCRAQQSLEFDKATKLAEEAKILD